MRFLLCCCCWCYFACCLVVVVVVVVVVLLLLLLLLLGGGGGGGGGVKVRHLVRSRPFGQTQLFSCFYTRTNQEVYYSMHGSLS